MDELVFELIEIVRTAAPELWRIGLRQVYVSILVGVYTVIVCVLLIIASVWIIRKNIRDGWDTEGFVPIGGGLIITASVVFALASIGKIIAMIINPEYYAILEIIRLVK